MTRAALRIAEPATPAPSPAAPKAIRLTVRETCALLGIEHKQSLLRDLRRGRFEFVTEVGSNGQPQHWISLASLPAEAQLRYWQERGKAIAAPEAMVATQTSPADDFEGELNLLQTAPAYARKKAEKYLAAIKMTEGYKGTELRAAIGRWNKEHPDFRTSYQSILKARAEYREHGIAGILAQYGWRAGETAVADDYFEYFLRLYLKEGGAPLYTCWVATMGHFAAMDESITKANFPSHAAFRRRLEREVPLPAVVKAREGEAVYNRRFGAYVERDLSAVNPGECWISDHAQIDVMVTGNDGRPVRPWVTAWRDFKSGAWLGWFAHVQAPNSDHIFHAFHLAALANGLPTDIIIDNGKDYRSKDFAGGRRVGVDEVQARSLVGALGITAHFAKPYNAKAKTIERDFHTQKLWFSRFMRGYTGGNVVEKPEALEGEIKSGSLMRLGEFIPLFDRFVREILNAMPCWGKVTQGASRQGYFDAHLVARRRVSSEALALFCMRTDGSFSIGRNGIHDSKHGLTYWDDRLVALAGRTRVYLRRDPANHLEAWVYREDDNTLVCKAAAIETPAALVNGERDRRTLAREASRVKRQEKIINHYVKQGETPPPREIIDAMATGAKLLAKPSAPPAAKVNEQVSITKMDHAIAAEKRMKAEGKADPKLATPPGKQAKPKETLSLFRSDYKQPPRKTA